MNTFCGNIPLFILQYQMKTEALKAGCKRNEKMSVRAADENLIKKLCMSGYVPSVMYMFVITALNSSGTYK